MNASLMRGDSAVAENEEEGLGNPLSFGAYHEWRLKREAKESMKEEYRKKKVANLQRMHHPLTGHWATNAGAIASKLDAPHSDLNYKMHVSRLKQIYLQHKSDFVIKMNEKTTGDLKLAQKPVMLLYGNDGLVNKAPGLKNWLKKQEKNWRDDFVYGDSLKDTNQQPQGGVDAAVRKSLQTNHAALSAAEPGSAWARGTSSSHFGPSRGAPTATGGGGSPPKRPASAGATRSVPAARAYSLKAPRSRSQQPVPDEDLTLLGYYWLSDSQGDVYAQFVRLLSEFDAYDVAKVTADASSDARAANSLDGYGGTTLTLPAPGTTQPPAAPVGVNSSSSSSSGGGAGQPRQRQRVADDLRRRLRFSDLSSVPAEDTVMLGLYALDDDQAAVYTAFVDMLSSGGFDAYDMRKIVHDAALDAASFNPLRFYSGTQLRSAEG